MELPALPPDELARRLAMALPGCELSGGRRKALWAYYEELRRWAPRVDLIGPGTAGEVVERHFAESLAALPWLPPGAARMADLGSGAGFPGLVLAAVRPDLEVHLVEPRERRRAFLAAVVRRLALRVQISGARVESGRPHDLPAELDLVTVRALKLPPAVWSGIAGRLRPGGRLLLWTGDDPPELPPEFVPGRQLLLPGSTGRYVREYRLEGPR